MDAVFFLWNSGGHVFKAASNANDLSSLAAQPLPGLLQHLLADRIHLRDRPLLGLTPHARSLLLGQVDLLIGRLHGLGVPFVPVAAFQAVCRNAFLLQRLVATSYCRQVDFANLPF